MPKRIGAREVRLCLLTHKLSVAVVLLELLLPLISSVKQLVIRSRTLDTDLVSLQFSHIKDAMLKQLEISDIDPLIANLEKGYSDKGHTLNALSHNSLLGLDETFKEQYLHIAQASDNEQRLVRFSEVVAGLTQEQKWPFLEFFSTVIKAMSFIDSDNVDNDEGLQDQATQLLNTAKKERTKWKKWIIYLGIYTGARRSELAQLRKNDIKFDEKANRHYLLITDEHESQKLKTVNSKRKIPLHRALVDEGFIDYVKACKDKVFEELSNVNMITGWMPRNMAHLDIPPTNELDHIRSFHSISHTFITKCMSEPDVNINLLQQIVGHEISSFGITSNYTHKDTDIKNLIPIIDAFTVE